MFVHKSSTLLLMAGFIINFSSCLEDSEQKPKPSPTPYHDWDYLLFSQRWPITGCMQWLTENINHTCEFPTNKTTWIVHGIWPTKNGTDGPLFCPSAIHFDPQQLEPMMDDLKEHWTNVEAGTKANSLWSHEWDKHGTCAATQPELDSVTNFFRQGLEWNKQFDLDSILESGKILPATGNGYTPESIFNAVKDFTKNVPMIECAVDSKTKESLISEIHICFDKNLEVIDCPNKSNQTIFSNCSLKKPVMYLDKVVPPITTTTSPVSYSVLQYELDISGEFQRDMETRTMLVAWYSFIKFLIWYTL